MPEGSTSTVRLRKIGRVLRQIREENGHTLKTAGRRVERSGSSLSLIENGQQPLRVRDLAYILDVYKVQDPLRRDLLTLAHQQQQSGWWTEFKGLATPSALDYASLEFDSAQVDNTETSFIPGLLQTVDYARVIIETNSPKLTPAQVERFIAFRLGRQQILNDSRPRLLQFIVDEGALRRMRGGRQVMRAQLQRLLESSEHEQVRMAVLPFALDPAPGYTGPFQIIHIGAPAILRSVLIDHMTGRWILENGQDIWQYQQRFTEVQTSALSETDSRDLIHRIRSEL